MPNLTKAMTSYLKRYRRPVFVDRGNHGGSWDSGAFIELDGAKFVLTNQHIAEVRHKGEWLGTCFDGQDQPVRLIGDHVETAWHRDLALLRVSEEAWASMERRSSEVQIKQIAADPPCAGIF